MATNFPDPTVGNHPETQAPWVEGDRFVDDNTGIIYYWYPPVWKTELSQSENDDRYVNISGDTMSGSLALSDKITLDATAGTGSFKNGNVNIGLDTPGAGDLQVGGDALANAGVVIYDSGTIVSTASANTEIFRGYLTGGTGDTVSITSTGNAVFAGDVQMASQNSGQLAGFRNQIINGDFRIWQRGTSFTSDTSSYCADRWRYSSATAPASATLDTTNLPSGFMYALSLNANVPAIEQPIELYRVGQNNQFSNGSTWTMSVWSTEDLTGVAARLDWKNSSKVSGTAAHAPAVYAPTGETSGDFSRYSATITITVNASAGNTSLAYILSTPNAKRITGVQVEPGGVATPFELRPIGTELALCQRYYQVVDEMSYIYYNTYNTEGRIPLPYATQMRAKPSLEVTQIYGTLKTSFVYSNTAILILQGDNTFLNWGNDIYLVDFRNIRLTAEL